MLEKFPTEVPVQSRVAVMILFSRGFSVNSDMADRLQYLHCALLKLKKHMMHSTTMDVFLWGLNTTESPLVVPSWFNESDFPRMHILTIPASVWRIPCGLKPDGEWAGRKHFDVNYYIMGRWRLTFGQDFARAMGYEYLLQLDDDALINTEISFNLTERMDANKFNIAVHPTIHTEPEWVINGLPEFTAFWLRISKYDPRGTIFQHTNPKNIHGLTTSGYDCSYYRGFFILTRVSWWFSEPVQDFLNYVLRSGRDVEGRWQEQAVMNMMFKIFLTQEEIWLVRELNMVHNRHKPETFENWCVRSGLIN